MGEGEGTISLHDLEQIDTDRFILGGRAAMALALASIKDHPKTLPMKRLAFGIPGVSPVLLGLVFLEKELWPGRGIDGKTRIP